VTVFDLRKAKLRPGEEIRETLAVPVEAFELGGERYLPRPETPEARLTVTRATTGVLFGLALELTLHGPCVRCLGEAVVPLRIEATEYEAERPESEELTTPYLEGDRLDVSAWARDAVALALPDQILCREDCAGLCPRCGANLNEQECACGPAELDPRLAPLANLRDLLAG
jgi:uncharacterized protein